ncbi:MAG: hypothetical protein FD129_2554 [bacterium]|nr:MAG: hypothetical protein FD129_2554 [bacterium]
MARIQWVDESDAEGEAAEVYRRYMQGAGRDYVPDILKCFSLRPDFLLQVMEFSRTVHFSDGHLDRAMKERIATFVSGLNRCPY